MEPKPKSVPAPKQAATLKPGAGLAPVHRSRTATVASISIVLGIVGICIVSLWSGKTAEGLLGLVIAGVMMWAKQELADSKASHDRQIQKVVSQLTLSRERTLKMLDAVESCFVVARVALSDRSKAHRAVEAAGRVYAYSPQASVALDHLRLAVERKFWVPTAKSVATARIKHLRLMIHLTAATQELSSADQDALWDDLEEMEECILRDLSTDLITPFLTRQLDAESTISSKQIRSEEHEETLNLAVLKNRQEASDLIERDLEPMMEKFTQILERHKTHAGITESQYA